MIVPLHDLSLFAGAALIMVLSPGPNMIYLVSRAVCQGRRAAEVSLLGVGLGFIVHMLVAACGLSAFFLAVPYAYSVLKYLGSLYLLWLAFNAVRRKTGGAFERKTYNQDAPAKLLWMGFVTNALNPKIALFYISIFTQFLNPARGSILGQSMVLGFTQIAISMTVNYLIIRFAGQIAEWVEGNPRWATVQRWGLATVLGGLAFKVALSERK